MIVPVIDYAAGSADQAIAIDTNCGAAGSWAVIEGGLGSASYLRVLCADYEDIQRIRIASTLRGNPGVAEQLHLLEAKVGRQIQLELRQHPIWPWLSQYPGMGGVTTARLIAIINDPWRFPGQPCTVGHLMAPVQPIGGPCPEQTRDETGDLHACTGTMLAPRRGTGVRSLWRYLGLDVADGKLPMRRKGSQGHWHVLGRSLVLNDKGIAGQIVLQRPPRYRAIYDAWKEAHGADGVSERESRAGADQSSEIEGGRGAEWAGAIDRSNGADVAVEIEAVPSADVVAEAEPQSGASMPPWRIHKIARTVAAKAFVGDLLMAWKEATRLG